MENKQIEIDCPCCSSRLTIDVLTRTVLRALSAQEREDGESGEQKAERWDKAQGRVNDRGGNAQDKLDTALSKEKRKESRFDDLFNQAQAKVKRREDEREDLEP